MNETSHPPVAASERVHPLVRVFEVANGLLGQSKCNLTPINDRTFRRWVNDGTTPSEAAARGVGCWLWDALDDARRVEARQKVMTAIQKQFPGTDTEQWDSAEAFGIWCAAQVAPEEPPPPPPPTLTLSARLLVHDRAAGGFVDLTPERLPAKPGQHLRIEVTPSRQCLLYLLWISPDGEAEPLHPWVGGSWDEPPSEESSVQGLRLPSDDTQGFPLEPGAGLETLLVLARETPFSAADLKELPGLLGGLPGLPKGRRRPSKDLHAFTLRPDVAPAALRRLNPVPRPVDDPVLKRHSALATRLVGRYAAGCCLTFANGG